MNFETLKQDLSDIVTHFHDFSDNFINYLAKVDGNQPWFWRIDDIFIGEAPVVLKQLALGLHLTDEFNLTIIVHGYEQLFSVHRAWMSINHDQDGWKNALERYSEDSEVNHLLQQLNGYPREMERALINIKGL